MSDPILAQQHWEQSLLSSFLGMVQAADGDFTAIDRLAKATGDGESLQLMVEHLSQYSQGKKAFESHFSLGIIDLEQLSKLSKNTLGHLYAKHMVDNNLKVLQAQPPENDYQFLSFHLTETHDIWHVITDSKTDIWGEIKLEAFYVAQLKMSRFWLALLSKNLLKSVLYNIELSNQYMDALTTGWLMGKKAKPLFGINWNTLWETPIDEVRKSLDITEV
jgi:ubiquinone biosynthesis protein COQ4